MNLEWINPKRLIEKIWEDELKISLFVLLIAFLAVNLPTILSGRYLEKKFLESLLANANSMILDILIILVLVTYLNKKSENRREIQRLKDEIDNLRNWESYEASHHLRGIIIRLNKLGTSTINLAKCYLREADLHDVNLSRANLEDVNCCNACLDGANLSEASMWLANFERAQLDYANLTRAILKDATLSRATLCGANFQETNLHAANLEGAVLWGADLTRANLSRATLKGAKLDEPDISVDFLMGADLNGADLSDANFSCVNLVGVRNLKQAKGIDSADFTNAIMDDETREFLSKINTTVKPLEKPEKENPESDKSA